MSKDDASKSVYIDMSLVEEFIYCCTTFELMSLAKMIGDVLGERTDFLAPENLYDSEKIIILKELFSKYNLEQLQELKAGLV